MKNYIILQHLDTMYLAELNKTTEQKGVKNNILKKAISLGICENKYNRELQSCFISSSNVYGLYYPNNEITMLFDTKADFICAVDNGLVIAYSNNYYLLKIEKLDLTKTLVLEGRGMDTHRTDFYKNYRYIVSIDIENQNRTYIDSYARENQEQIIEKMYIDFGGNNTYGYYVKNGSYKRVPKGDKISMHFDCEIDLKNHSAYRYGVINYKNVFDDYKHYINALGLDYVSVKNGTKYANRYGYSENVFIEYNEQNLLKIVNHLAQKNFENTIVCTRIYDTKGNEVNN